MAYRIDFLQGLNVSNRERVILSAKMGRPVDSKTSSILKKSTLTSVLRKRRSVQILNFSNIVPVQANGQVRTVRRDAHAKTAEFAKA